MIDDVPLTTAAVPGIVIQRNAGHIWKGRTRQYMTVTTHRWIEYENGMGVVRMRSRPVSESVRESRAFNKEAKGYERRLGEYFTQVLTGCGRINRLPSLQSGDIGALPEVLVCENGLLSWDLTRYNEISRGMLWETTCSLMVALALAAFFPLISFPRLVNWRTNRENGKTSKMANLGGLRAGNRKESSPGRALKDPEVGDLGPEVTGRGN